MCVQLRRHTPTASHLIIDDIDTCTMEEARNLNSCRTDGGGASELQHLVIDDIDTCTMEEARNLNSCRTDGGGASELQHKIV